MKPLPDVKVVMRGLQLMALEQPPQGNIGKRQFYYSEAGLQKDYPEQFKNTELDKVKPLLPVKFVNKMPPVTNNKIVTKTVTPPVKTENVVSKKIEAKVVCIV